MTDRPKLAVLNSVQGHNASVAHTFNHTNGACPKCGCPQSHIGFCLPFQSELPRASRCELDGEHLHRICAACGYPWVERCLDQAMLSEKAGDMIAESEMAAALAVLIHRAGGASLEQPVVEACRGWTLHFTRDPDSRSLVITTHPTPPEGKITHPIAPPDPNQPVA